MIYWALLMRQEGFTLVTKNNFFMTSHKPWIKTKTDIKPINPQT